MKVLGCIVYSAIFLIICVFSIQETLSQNYIILSNGIEKVKLKPGQIVGITLKGQENIFAKWNNICKCDTNEVRKLWIVDNVGKDSITVWRTNYRISFNNDTVIRCHSSAYKKKGFVLESVIPSSSHKKRFDKLVYRVPAVELVNNEYVNISYSDISSFSFAKAGISKCRYSGNSGHGFIPSANFVGGGSPEAALVMLAVLSVEIAVYATIAIIENIKEQVRTYDLGKWKLKVVE